MTHPRLAASLLLPAKLNDGVSWFRVEQRRVPAWLVPWLLALPTVLLALWVMVGWGFNGLYGQDPYAYYDFGVGPLRHSILSGAALAPMFWPLGHPLLVTIASLIVGPNPVAGQIVSLLAGAASVWLTYLLTRDLLLQAGAEPAFARRAGVVGATLMGVTGWLVQSSVQIMPDSVALATSLLSAWALVRWRRDDASAAWLALAAAALAWSTVTRWGQGALALVWLLAALPAIRSQPSRFWRALPWAVLPAAAIVAVQLWLVFTVPPGPFLGPHPFAGDLSLVQDNGWALPHLFQRDFVNADGHQHYTWPNLFFYAWAVFRPTYLSPLFAPAVALGIVMTVARYRRSIALLLGWPAVLLVLDSGLAEQNPRFVLAALPPVAILAGLGIAAVWEQLVPGQPAGFRLRPAGFRLRRAVFAMSVIAGLLLVAGLGLRDVHQVVAARNADLQVARWAAARIPSGAITMSFEITLTLEHTTRLHPLDLSTVSRRDLNRLTTGSDQSVSGSSQPLSTCRPLYLLVRVGKMEGQFAPRTPGANYRFLRDGPGLAQLGELQGYTLFRVKERGCRVPSG